MFGAMVSLWPGRGGFGLRAVVLLKDVREKPVPFLLTKE